MSGNKITFPFSRFHIKGKRCVSKNKLCHSFPQGDSSLRSLLLLFPEALTFSKRLFQVCIVAFWKIEWTLKTPWLSAATHWRVVGQMLLFSQDSFSVGGTKIAIFLFFSDTMVEWSGWMDIHDITPILLLANCYSRHFRVPFEESLVWKKEMEKSHKKRQSVFRLPWLVSVLIAYGVRNVFLKESQKTSLFLPQVSVPYQTAKEIRSKRGSGGHRRKRGKTFLVCKQRHVCRKTGRQCCFSGWKIKVTFWH